MGKTTDIEKLFEFACNGNIDGLKQYYEGGGETNRRYERFGYLHSLIMGAFRNRQFNTVEYLLSQGETILREELEEISDQFREIELMKKTIAM